MIRSLSRRRLLVVIALIALTAIIFHRKLLTAAAYPLTRADKPSDRATHLLILRSAKTVPAVFDYVTTFAQQDATHRVLVLRDFVRRSEEIGATASFVDETIEMLVESGVPIDQIQTIGDGQAMSTAEQMSSVKTWLEEQLQEQPDLRLHVVTRRFESGFVCTSADDIVPSELRQRMHVLGFERGVSASNWWKSARGMKSCIRAYLRLIHFHLFGDQRPTISWDPDRYEESLRQSLAEQAND